MVCPKISIIVPIYNAESTLRRCVDSVLSQSFRDFECLLIDDGSTDKSGEICDDYVEKDSRVKVFHTENRGVSSARNVGLENMRGEWVTFLDSDDWIDEYYFQVAQADIEIDTQFIAYSCHPCDFDGQEYLPDFDSSSKVQTKDVISSRLSSLLFMVSWAKLFKSSIIRNYKLCFNVNLQCGEDTLFNIGYLQYVEKISMRSKRVYHYSRGGNTSLSKQELSWEQIEFILCELFGAIESLERAFIADLYKFKIDLAFGKFVLYLNSLSGGSFRYIVNNIKRLLTSRFVSLVIKDSVVIRKGLRRKFVDFCLNSKWVFVLSVYVKYGRSLY